MIDYKLVEALLRQVKTGAFLTTKVGNQVNTMTISWLTLGQVWNLDVVTVYVRFSRYTYDLIENSKNFTVSFPCPRTKIKELKEWGERSGRDYKKLTMTDIISTKAVDGVLIKDCNIHIECEKIYDQKMNSKQLAKDLLQEFYDEKEDYHHIYYGKIVDMYLEERLSVFPGE